MIKNTKDIQNEVLDKILDEKDESYYEAKDREFEYLDESKEKHFKDSTKHNAKLMKRLSKL